MRVVLCAGEASGDILGAGLIDAIRQKRPDATFEGIAGPKMQAAGCESVYPMERLSVMGLVEVAARYVEILPERRALARRFKASPPDVFVGIDAPDFNLGLERMLRGAGIPTVHYVSPSVWAWREYRVRKIKRSIDRMLVLFPFEQAFYRKHGIEATLVGHHLADQIPLHVDAAEARAVLGLPESGAVVALLPGSRMSEAQPLSMPLLESALWIHRRRKDVRFIVPLASAAIGECVDAALKQVMAASGVTSLGDVVRCVDGRSQDAMAASDLVVLASGTASLEAALLKRPMVITYRTHPVTWEIGRRMLNVPYVGLPNLLAGTLVAPELLQDEARPARLGATALGLLDSSDARARQIRHFGEIHTRLRLGASARAADAVLALAAERAGMSV